MRPIDPAAVGMSAEALGQIRAEVAAAIAAGAVPGALTLIARRGQIVHLDCQGQLGPADARPVRPDTLFRIYSLTKPLTCAAMLMLVEAGRARLDDPVARYLPRFAHLQVHDAASGRLTPLARPITIHHLLSHTAGLGYGLLDDSPVEDAYRAAGLLTRELTLRPALAELAELVAGLPLAHQPGSAWRYSVGHDIVAHLVARIADMPFADFLAERICAPLGMVDTSFQVPEAQRGRLAALAARRASGAVTPFVPAGAGVYAGAGAEPAGGGGLVATAGDYLRFAELLRGEGRLLAPASRARMVSNQIPPAALPFQIGPGWVWAGYGYGYGLAVLEDAGRAGVAGHAGSVEWEGVAGTLCWVDPRAELVGLVLTQVLRGPANPPLARRVRELAYQALGPRGAAPGG